LQRRMLRMSPSERRRMPGMNPRRSDIIVAGNAIVMTALELLGRQDIVVCEHALRDGVVVDFLERNNTVTRRLGSERLSRLDAARALAKRFGSDGVHENHVAQLAVNLFDGLRDLHAFEPADRDVLFVAALLHDIGRAISSSAHHKHGAYIVRNAGLGGWRPQEVELIALLVRYHRKSSPKQSHPEWAAADEPQRRKIAGLAALVRLADGLDARRLGVVSHVEVARSSAGITLEVHAEQDVAPEIAGAVWKSDLFARTFGVPVQIVAAPRDDYGLGGESDPSATERDAASISG
jgi:exopolyphosphatase / guanosine-5'-triphosphate,3'-diphosphate pyrophosphatase